MLTWKRPQKHHHMKERIFPVLPVQKLSKSVHGAWRNPKFRSFFFVYKKKMCEWMADILFKALWTPHREQCQSDPAKRLAEAQAN